MLQDRQLIEPDGDLPRDLIDEFVRHVGCDRAAEHPRWANDGLAQLITCQAGRQILRAVDGFRQIEEPHAVAQEIRAHRDGDEDLRRRFRPRPQKQTDECLCFVRLRGARFWIAEQLLELIDEHEQVERR